MSVGHGPAEPQWAPDMRRDDRDITAADKADAKRRIQGQVGNPDESPDEMSASGSGSGDDRQQQRGAGQQGGAGGGSVKVPPVASFAG